MVPDLGARPACRIYSGGGLQLPLCLLLPEPAPQAPQSSAMYGEELTQSSTAQAPVSWPPLRAAWFSVNHIAGSRLRGWGHFLLEGTLEDGLDYVWTRLSTV